MKKRTYIYRGFERFWHWTQSLLIIFLAITGFEIHSSYSLFGFERAVLLHDILAWAYIILIIFSIFWHIDSGTWKQYVPTLKLVKAQFEYYVSGIFRGAEHPTKKTSYNKFNPIQRLTYLAFKILIIPVMVGTGIVYMFFMYPESNVGVDKLEIVALIHTFGAFLLIVFLIVHLYLLTTNHDPMESIVAMITGWEEVDIDPEEEHRLHMQYAVDKSVAGYYRLDAKGNFLDVNQAWLDLYKCEDINEIIGENCSLSRSNQQQVKELNELVDRAMKGESIRGIPSVRKCFDGSKGKHILSINPTYDNDEIIGVEGFVIDISDVSSVHDEMYHSVRNNMSGYYKINKEGYFEDVNDVWLKIYKFKAKEDVVGKHYSEIKESRDLKKIADNFNKTLKGETVKTQLVNRKFSDGTAGSHILSVSPYYEGDKIVGMEGFTLDVTDLDLEKKI